MRKEKAFLVLFAVLGLSLFAGDFGSASARDAKNFDLEEMMLYALQDEHLAFAEYEALIDEFGLERPFSNIIKAEEKHIEMLEELYADLGLSVPSVNAADHINLPDSPADAAALGVEAEINNIAMYQLFLERDLPESAREVFTYLMNSSENHLEAFQRQVEKGTREGRGRNRT